MPRLVSVNHPLYNLGGITIPPGDGMEEERTIRRRI